MTQFRLVRDRRFSGLFWTQFLGAFNDNFYKTALVVLVTFGVLSESLDSRVWVPVLNGLLILPMFLFSANAGQIADKWEKSRVIRWVKVWEILVMLTAAVGFWFTSIWILSIALLLMGTQSAFFGPAKYGILPQLVSDDELVAGNALIGTGTFLAILLGTILGSVLWSVDAARAIIAVLILTVAVAGYWTSRRVPRVRVSDSSQRLDWNPFRQTIRVLRFAHADATIFHSILGIAWFWFFGATLITLFPNFGRRMLGVDEIVVTFFLVEFCVGIAIGSLFCDRLARQRVELGLVPIGAAGLSLFAADIFLATLAYQGVPGGELRGLAEFFGTPGSLRIAFDLLGLAIFGGVYIVPLNALVQQKAPEAIRAQIISANNLMAALFMVFSSIMTTVFGALSIPSTVTYVVLAVLNAVVCLYIFLLIPEFTLRLLVWLLVNVVYRLRVLGLERIPDEGPVLIASNHVTYVDGLVMTAALKRPVRFVMYHKFVELPLMRWIAKQGYVIPIAGRKESPEILQRAMDAVAEGLERGDVICIFPEGALTVDGEMAEFRTGIERIVGRTPVPVTPVGLRGLWGALFSLKVPNVKNLFRGKLFPRVSVVIGEPVEAAEVTAEAIQTQVSDLRGGVA